MILLIYSDKWVQAIPFMQIISFQYLFDIIGITNLQAMNAVGRSDVTFKLEFVKKPFFLGILLYTMTISPLAMTIGCLIYSVIVGGINAFPNKRLIDYRYRDQIIDILPNVLLSLAMGICLYFIGLLPLNTIIQLFLQIVFGFLFYFGAAWIMGFETLRYICNTIKELIKKK